MKKQYRIMLAISIGTMLLTGFGTAHASGDRKNYIVGQAGVYKPTSGLDDGDYDPGFNGAFGYGRYLTPNIAIEGMIDGFGTKAESNGSNSTLGNYSQDNNVFATGLLVTLKGEIPLGVVDLFGGAGVGLYGVSLSSEVDSSQLGKFEEQNEFDTAFGVHASLGANFNITEMFYVGIEGRYRWTGDVKINETVADIPVSYEGDLNGYTVAGTFGFRF